MKEEEYIREAQKRVKKIKDFWSHFWSWAITCGFLLALNLFTSPGYLWAFFPIAGWGLGLAFHAFDVFGYPGFGKDWEEKALRKEALRLKDRAQELNLDEPETAKAQEEEELVLPPLEKKYQDDELV